MTSVSIVMLVNLAMLSAQVKVRIGTVICPYSSLEWGQNNVTLVMSLTSGTLITPVRLMTLLTSVTLEISNTSVITDASN